MKERLGVEKLEDPDLAYLLDGEPAFDAYIQDMLWAQRYAMGNRQVMNKALLAAVFKVMRKGRVARTINCHHNFTQRETHGGVEMWITRKGAIKAAKGDLGSSPARWAPAAMSWRASARRCPTSPAATVQVAE